MAPQTHGAVLDQSDPAAIALWGTAKHSLTLSTTKHIKLHYRLEAHRSQIYNIKTLINKLFTRAPSKTRWSQIKADTVTAQVRTGGTVLAAEELAEHQEVCLICAPAFYFIFFSDKGSFIIQKISHLAWLCSNKNIISLLYIEMEIQMKWCVFYFFIFTINLIKHKFYKIKYVLRYCSTKLKLIKVWLNIYKNVMVL